MKQYKAVLFEMDGLLPPHVVQFEAKSKAQARTIARELKTDELRLVKIICITDNVEI